MATALLLAAALLGGGAASAAPNEGATSTPSPSPALTILSPDSNIFSPDGTATVSGTALPNAVVTVTVGVGRGSATSDGNGRWTVPVSGIANGAEQAIVASSSGQDSQSESGFVSVLRTPAIMTSSTQSGIIAGSGADGATVTVTGLNLPVQQRSAQVSGGSWQIQFTQAQLAAGRYEISATQSVSGSGWPDGRVTSAATTAAVVVSWPTTPPTDPVEPETPQPPAITSPASGARITSSPVQVSGTGADGATVSVFADNGSGSCTATVAGGRWSCAVPVTGRGTITFYASQALDPARPSQPGTLSIALALAAAGDGDEEEDEEQQPEPSATASPDPEESTTPTPIPGIDADDDQGGIGREPVGPIERSLGTGWGVPTGFGFMLPDARSILDPIRWVTAIALAIAFVVLVALPLRLLFAALHRRFHVPRLHLTGRNQNVPAEPEADGPPLAPRTLAAVTLAGSAAVIALAWGVDAQPSSLRLLVAIGIGLLLLNTLAVVLPAWIGRRRLGLRIEVRTLPFLVLVGAVLAFFSRGLALDPPIITGVIGTFAFLAGESRGRRVAVNLGQFGTIFFVSIAAWWAHALIGPGAGAERVLLREILATMVLAGVGSLVVLALPVRGLPGRLVYDWSRPVWIGTASTSVVLAALLLLGDLGTTHFPALLLGILAACFGGLCVLVWAWFRFAHDFVLRGGSVPSRG
jgi:hypothetical protein